MERYFLFCYSRFATNYDNRNKILLNIPFSAVVMNVPCSNRGFILHYVILDVLIKTVYIIRTVYDLMNMRLVYLLRNPIRLLTD